MEYHISITQQKKGWSIVISLSIKYHEEPKPNTPPTTTHGKQTFTARQCYTLIKKYKKSGYKIGETVGTKYSDKPIGIIVAYVTPPKDGITVWGTEPSLIKIKNLYTNSEMCYRKDELALYKADKTTGEYQKC